MDILPCPHSRLQKFLTHLTCRNWPNSIEFRTPGMERELGDNTVVLDSEERMMTSGP